MPLGVVGARRVLGWWWDPSSQVTAGRADSANNGRVVTEVSRDMLPWVVVAVATLGGWLGDAAGVAAVSDASQVAGLGANVGCRRGGWPRNIGFGNGGEGAGYSAPGVSR